VSTVWVQNLFGLDFMGNGDVLCEPQFVMDAENEGNLKCHKMSQ